MNLWTFVLLGFLAHSSSSTGNNYAVNEKQLTAKISKEMKKELDKMDGKSLPPVNLPGNGNANPICKGHRNLTITFTKRSDGNYSFKIGGPITVTSPQTAGTLILQVNGNAIFSLDVVNGIVKCTPVDPAAVTTIVLKEVAGLAGGLLGTLLDIVGETLQSVLNLFTASCKKGLEGQVTRTFTIALNNVNSQLQGLSGLLENGLTSVENLLMNLPSGFVPVGQNGKCNCGTGQGGGQGEHPGGQSEN